jgi:hypothetical protein
MDSFRSIPNNGSAVKEAEVPHLFKRDQHI